MLKKQPVKIDHCALGWSFYPQCGYSDGTVLPTKAADLVINARYYLHAPKDMNAWPVDPDTGQRLPQTP